MIVDNESVGSVQSYTFNDIRDNHSISADFVAVYNISSEAGLGGTISPLGVTQVDESSSLTFTIIPIQKYTIRDVYVDGASAGAVSSYTFENISQNHTIKAVFAAPKGRTYSIIDLGTLGGSWSYAYGINDSGQVVGYSDVSGSSTYHAFLYSNGVMRDLDGSDNSITSIATGINNSGDIAGYFYPDSNGSPHRAFLYSSGIKNDLGTLSAGTWSVATAINNSGQIAGYAGISNGRHHAFLYSDGVMSDLDISDPSLFSEAMSINNSGDVAGCFGSNVSPPHAFLYSGGTKIDLGLLSSGTGSIATAINNSGLIAGYADTSDRYMHAFLYSGGVMTDLGNIGAGTYPCAINDAGQIVGSCYGSATDAAPYFAFLYTDGTFVDLNALLPDGSGWILEQANGINNKGQIVGYGRHNGSSHAFLMTPVSIDPILLLLMDD